MDLLFAGLDVDKMDYLLRDQHNVFGQHPPGRFHKLSQLDSLLQHARVVAVESINEHGKREVVTEIAFEETSDHEYVKLVDDIFQTRSIMHERVYQCGCEASPHNSQYCQAWEQGCSQEDQTCCREVVACEERMLHLLHRLPKDKYPWARMSDDPVKFLTLHDSILDQVMQEPSVCRELRMLDGVGGWKAVGPPWSVPEALLAHRKRRVIQGQVCLQPGCLLAALSLSPRGHLASCTVMLPVQTAAEHSSHQNSLCAAIVALFQH